MKSKFHSFAHKIILLSFFLPGWNSEASLDSVPEGKVLRERPFKGVPLVSSNVQNLAANNLIALYSDRGSWQLGREHLKMFLIQYQFPFEEIKKQDVLSGKLNSGRYSTLIMPGGASWNYLEDLGEVGANEIRQFVAKGNSYLGICAGAFYATTMRNGGAATGEYGIGLLDGASFDGTALEHPAFKEGIMKFPFQYPKLKNQYEIVLLGGPSFQVYKNVADSIQLEVWDKFEKLDEPSMIFFKFEKGKVFLTGPHPEVEENKTGWGPEWFDPESDWPILEAALLKLRRLE